ncbi:MAG: FkbM family methyltransferase [Rhizomicrobium sp.]
MILDALQALRAEGYSPRTMLDIGAHIGSFTRDFLGVYPGCVPTLMEPNPFCLADLGKLGFEQHGVAASAEAGFAEMFLSREWLQSTGASIYRENTAHFRDEVVFKQRVEKVRLDDLFAGRKFDFVKIDTQGSELDVIRGGAEILRQADYILVEVSLVEYNIGGAAAEALFAKLAELGFHCTDVTEFHRLAGVHDGNLLQIDVLFERRGGAAQPGRNAGALDDLRGLAQSLCRDGRYHDALLLLDRLEILQPGHVETLRQRVSILRGQGRTLEALQALAAMKARTGDVAYLLDEIGAQMPAALELFNTNLAAGKVEAAEEYIAALAALLPGNAAIVNAALACNAKLGREEHVQKYLSAAHALNAANGAARPAQHA